MLGTALILFQEALHRLDDALPFLLVRPVPGLVNLHDARRQRWLHIEASGEFFRSSDIQLDGDKAPLVNEFLLKGLPGGEHTVTAVLFDTMGERTTARRTALVLSRLGEP